MKTDNGRLGDRDYPCATLDEALPHLRRPPTPEAVRFKIQDVLAEVAQVVPYIDARLVYERLDQVCGRSWTAHWAPLPERFLPPPGDRLPVHAACELTVLGTGRRDVGEGHDPKAAHSDAVKRAAVHFGIGRALYEVRAPWLGRGDDDHQLRTDTSGRPVLDERTEEWCRGRYADWLERRGVAIFGAPLAYEVQDGGEHARSGPRALLRAVDDPDVSEDELRARVERWRSRGRLSASTVEALSGLLLGQPDPSQLGRVQLGQLAWQLEVAVRGHASNAELAEEVASIEHADDRETALAAFADRRVQAAQEVGLLGKRVVRGSGRTGTAA